VKVAVDHDQCEGNRKCQMAAPTVFEVRDDDLSWVLVDDVPEALVEPVNRAIRLCPKLAIAWVGTSGPGPE
jgi:ferredoxin